MELRQTPPTQLDEDLDQPYVVAQSVEAQDRINAVMERRRKRLREQGQQAATDVELTRPMEPDMPASTVQAAPPEDDDADQAFPGVAPEVVQIVGGVRDAFVNTMQQIHALGNWFRAKGIGPKGVLQVHVPEIEKPDTIGGNLLRNVSQFLTGFIPGMKVAGMLGVTGKVTSGMVAGGIADLAVFDPREPRVSNLINNLSPEVAKPLTDFIKSDPEDSRAEATFKQILEGLALGGMVDGLLLVGRSMRSAAAARLGAVQSGMPEMADAAAKGVDDLPVRPEPADIASTRNQNGFQELSMTEEFEGISTRPVMSQADEMLELQQFIRKHGGIRTSQEELSGELLALVSPREVGTTGLMNNQSGISLQQMAELAEGAGFTLTADKEALLEALDRSVRGQKVISSMHPQALGQIGIDPALQEAYRDFKQIALNYDDLTAEMVAGRRSLDMVTEEAKALIDSKQFTLDDVRNIFPNQAMSDVQASAMMQSLTKLGLATRHIAGQYLETQSDEHFTNLLTALGMLGELDPARMGVRAANSRALGVWRDPVRSFNEFLNQFEDVFDVAKGLDAPQGSTLTRQRFAEMIAQLQTPQQLSVTARQLQQTATKATMADVIQEAWISGLLSGPQTQMANILSNSATAIWAIPERWLASGLGDVAPQEAVGMVFGLVKGLPEAFRLFRQSFMEERQLTGLTKIEGRMEKAISAESMQLSGNLGKAVDYLGKGVRLGPRMLTAADEFFKAINYRMELYAQAYRTAKQVAGDDPEMLGRAMAEVINNPPRKVHEAALDFGFYQTFTRDLATEGVAFERLGQASQQLSEALNTFPMGRVVAPFVRTPVNILRYTMERTPLGLFSRNIRKQLADPGPQGALTRAKLMLGSGMMATFAAYAAEGRISGRGPSDPVLRQRQRETGWQPYSVRFGDTWVSYNRLDPIGQLIGISADISQMLGEVDEVTASRLAGAALSSIWQNLSSKTYMRGVADAIKVLAPDAWSDPERSIAPGERYVQRLAGSVVPTFLAQVGRSADIGGDPVLREVREPGFMQDLLNTVYSRIPGYSDTLEPRLNLWAEPIKLGGGLGPDLISPLYIETRKTDPVADEIVRLGVPIRMPTRAFQFRDGDRPLELTSKEYNDFVRLSNGIGVPGVPKLKDALGQLLTQPSYQRMSDGPRGGKALAIQKIVNTYRQAARLMLPQKHEDLGRRMRKRARDAKLQLIPEGPQRDQMEQQLDAAEQQLTIR